MCTIQMYGYVINGSHVNDPCSATFGDKIEAEVDVQFDSSEIGKSVRAMVGVTLPDGTGNAFDSQIIFISDTTIQTFVVTLTPYFTVGGLYKIGSVFINEPQTGSNLCHSNTPEWCSNLTLKAPVLVPCAITAGYFIKNGSPISGASCNANQGDAISVEVDATFSGADIGQAYAAQATIKKPDGSTLTISSLYETATSTTKFIFGNWSTPIPTGVYTIVQFSIIDIYGNIFCGPTTTGGGYCQAITIQPAATTLTTITISPASATVGIAGTSPLTAVCKDQNGNTIACPTAQFSWSSDNNSVATVDGLSGLVTGVSAGTANITLKVGTIVSNKAVITVSATATSLASITISTTSATIGTGGTSQLTVVCYDTKGNVMTCPSLIWDSDNVGVAIVMEFTGEVIGITSGTANITARVGTIVSNKIAITVSSSAPSLASITISPASANIGIGGTLQLTAVCKDQTGNVMACPVLSWNSDTPGVAIVSGGLVIGLDVGAANITAQVGTIVSNKAVITVGTAAPSTSRPTHKQYRRHSCCRAAGSRGRWHSDFRR